MPASVYSSFLSARMGCALHPLGTRTQRCVSTRTGEWLFSLSAWLSCQQVWVVYCSRWVRVPNDRALVFCGRSRFLCTMPSHRPSCQRTALFLPGSRIGLSGGALWLWVCVSNDHAPVLCWQCPHLCMALLSAYMDCALQSLGTRTQRLCPDLL
jgi:hypothetical protein